MKWTPRLVGDNVDLRTLAAMLEHGDPRVTMDAGGNYALESSLLDPPATAVEVHAAADRLLTMVNGAAKALDPSYRPVRLAREVLGEDGIHAVIGDESIIVGGRVKVPAPTRSSSRPSEVPASPATAWLSLARSNDDVAGALLLLGSVDLGWAAMAALVERVEHDAGSTTKVLEEGWATRRDVSAFGAGVVGRPTHGDPPEPAMTLVEGRWFVHGLVLAWLQWRARTP